MLRLSLVRRHGPAHEKRAAQIHIQHQVPVFERGLRQGALPQQPGVVDEHGRRTQSLRHLFDGIMDRRFIGNVDSDCNRS